MGARRRKRKSHYGWVEKDGRVEMGQGEGGG